MSKVKIKVDAKNHQDAEEIVKELINEGNKRRIIFRKATGEALFEIPLTISIGLMVIGFFFFLPVAIFAGVFAYISKVKIDVVRELSDDEVHLHDSNQQDTLVDHLPEQNEGQATLVL